MDQPRNRFIAMVIAGLLLLLGSVFVASRLVGSGGGGALDEPLSVTSALHDSPSYLATESVLIAVEPPTVDKSKDGIDPESNPDTPPSSQASQPQTPVSVVTPQPTLQPQSTPLPANPPKPPEVNPGPVNQFKVGTFSAESGPLSVQNPMTHMGFWSLNSAAKNNGATEVKVSTQMVNHPGKGNYGLNLVYGFANSDREFGIIRLENYVFDLGGARGAAFLVTRATDAISPVGNVTQYEYDTRVSRLMNWAVGTNYQFIVRKDTLRSTPQHTWWGGYIGQNNGSELFVGALKVPVSYGNIYLDYSYTARWGVPMTCGTIPQARSRYFNVRHNGVPAVGVSVNVNQYPDCRNMFSHKAYSSNGYESIINPGR